MKTTLAVFAFIVAAGFFNLVLAAFITILRAAPRKTERYVIVLPLQQPSSVPAVIHAGEVHAPSQTLLFTEQQYDSLKLVVNASDMSAFLVNWNATSGLNGGNFGIRHSVGRLPPALMGT